jgi:hypothetical protein
MAGVCTTAPLHQSRNHFWKFMTGHHPDSFQPGELPRRQDAFTTVVLSRYTYTDHHSYRTVRALISATDVPTQMRNHAPGHRREHGTCQGHIARTLRHACCARGRRVGTVGCGKIACPRCRPSRAPRSLTFIDGIDHPQALCALPHGADLMCA